MRQRGTQLFHRERFDEIVVSAFPKRANGICHHPVGGNHDDRGRFFQIGDLLEYIEPADARKIHVQEHEVETALLHCREGFLAVAGTPDFVVRAELGAYEIAGCLLVLNDEDAAVLFHRCPPAGLRRSRIVATVPPPLPTLKSSCMP